MQSAKSEHEFSGVQHRIKILKYIKKNIINRNILKVQISESDIVEFGSANMLRKQGIQNK